MSAAVELDGDSAAQLAAALHLLASRSRQEGLTWAGPLTVLQGACETIAQTGDVMQVTVARAGSAATRVGTVAAGRDDDQHDDELLSRQDAAGIARCSVDTVDRRIADGTLVSVKVGRSRRIRRADLDAFLGR